ncbi:MAG: NADH-quinone oxidoreductase subunit N, partial [Pseudomonadota bacterium]
FYYLRIVYYMYFGEDGQDELETNASPVLFGFLMASAVIMVFGIINMFGVEGAAAAAAGVLIN